MPEPTPDEKRNGWDKKSLDRYVAEREKAQLAKVSFDPRFRPKARPATANSKYSPFRWRG